MKNKVVVVTGAASGIGKACVARFVREGASVVLADREDVTAAAADIEANGGSALGISTDVRVPESSNVRDRFNLDRPRR